MPDPNDCPECEAKIILDGDLVEAVFKTTCEAIERYLASGKRLQHTDKILEKLIIAEDAAFAFQRAVLQGMGYSGPWPKCLS